ALAVGYLVRQWLWESSPTPPLATLPRGCIQAEGATVITDRFKLQYYSRIDYRLADGTRIPVRVVPPVGGEGPPTFYIMQDRVCKELVGRFVRPATCKDAAALLGGLAAPANTPLDRAALLMARFAEASQWHLGAAVDRLEEGVVLPQPLGAENPRLPVFR